MKLIWNLASPTVKTGYSICGRNIVPRIVNDGNEVIFASSTTEEEYTWNGIKCIIGRDPVRLRTYADHMKADYTFTLQAPWDPPTVLQNAVVLSVFDLEHGYINMVEKVKDSRFQFCVSQHNLKEYRQLGLNPFYCPWGIDINVFKKKTGSRDKFNKLYNIPDNTFLIGSVGQSMHSDRKNFVGLLRAFAYFCQKHDNAMLYIHTTSTPAYSVFSDFLNSSPGYIPDLQALINNFGIKDKVIFPDTIKYAFHQFSEDYMVDMYNAFDVFCLPTKGESFGLPILESQACETPVIVTDTTSCPEMVDTKSGWLIPVAEDDYFYTDTQTFAANPRPKMIAEYLEYGLEAWENNTLDEMGKQARDSILHFNWDNVFDKHWRPFLEILRRNA